jgi:hypothetical protein
MFKKDKKIKNKRKEKKNGKRKKGRDRVEIHHLLLCTFTRVDLHPHYP